jgi:Cu/Ag efflux pump CusA
MAIVILGGLLTSMALNLLVLPTLALRYGRFERVRDEFTRLVVTESKAAE